MANVTMDFSQAYGSPLEMELGDSLVIAGTPGTGSGVYYVYKLSVSGQTLGEVMIGGLGSNSQGGVDKAYLVPDSIMALAPGATRISCTIQQYKHTVTTPQTADTLISTRTFYVKVVAPSITGAAPCESSDTASISQRFGGFVQSKSRIGYAISATPPTGAVLVKAEIYEGLDASNGMLLGSWSDVSGVQTMVGFVVCESQPVSKSGALQRTIVVIDSRGNKGYINAYPTVLEYAPPSITSLSLNRVLSNGTPSVNGTYLNVVALAACQSLKSGGVEKNTASLTLRYRASGSTGGYTSVALSASPGSIAVSQTLSASYQFATGTSYEFELVIADYFGSATRVGNLGQAFRLVNFHTGGRALSIGKTATDGTLFDVALNTKLAGTLAVSGTESHASTETHNGYEYHYGPAYFYNGVYISPPLPVSSGGTGVTSLYDLKTAMGISIPEMQYGKLMFNIPASADPVVYTVYYDRAFSSTPKTVQITLETAQYNYFHQIACGVYYSAANCFQLAVRNSTSSAKQCYFNYLAIL